VFDQLKKVFTSRPLLVAPDLDRELRVEADASNFTIGGALSIKCEDGVTNFIRPITPWILARFPRSKMRRKALKETFQMMPKMCQSNQYSLRY